MDRSPYLEDQRIFAQTLALGHQQWRLLTPLQLLAVRNHIVERLCHVDIVTRVLDHMSEYRHQRGTVEGRWYLRLWLDILLKLCNAPNRLQCSTGLEVPRQALAEDMMARLVYARHGQLERLFFLDKVGKSRRMPVACQLGPFLSLFCAAYLLYVTPVGSRYVFSDSPTQQWSAKCGGFRKFLTTDAGPVNLPTWIIPDQKMLRRLGVVALATKFQFEHDATEDVAHLARHSLSTLLTEYATWSKVFTQRSDQGPLWYLEPQLPSHVPDQMITDVWAQMNSTYPLPRVDQPAIVVALPRIVPATAGGTRTHPREYTGGVRPRCTTCQCRVDFLSFGPGHRYLLTCPDEHEYFYTILDIRQLPLTEAPLVLSGPAIQSLDRPYKCALPVRPARPVRPVRPARPARPAQPARLALGPTGPPVLHVGLDLSPTCVAVCMMYHVDQYTVTYLYNNPSTLFQTDGFVAVAYDPTIPRDAAERVGELLRVEINRMSVTKVHVQYEAALPHRKNVSESQRKYIETFVREVHARLQTYGIYVRLEMLDTRLVKACWFRSLGTEPAIPPGDARLYEEIQTYIQGHTKRPDITAPQRVFVKQAHKFANYLVWKARGLPDLLDPISVDWSIPSTSMKDIHAHPVSDIVDAYMLARHGYFQSLYSGATEQAPEPLEPPLEPLEPPPEPEEQDRFSPKTGSYTIGGLGALVYYIVELTDHSWEERKHYQDEVVVNHDGTDYDTGTYVCQGNPTTNGDTDDRHATVQELRADPRRADLDDPERAFVFVRRRHESDGENFNRARREIREWYTQSHPSAP